MNSARLTALNRWLASRRFRYILLMLGVLLVLPSISNRLVLDDYLQALNRISKPAIDGVDYRWWDLFVFGKPGAVNRGFMERGILLPWWTYPGYQVAFFRPLSAFTHLIDGWLWPRSPALAHVHSIVWYALALVLVTRLYARLVQPAYLAGIACLLFVIDDTHGETLSWIANRHAIIATVFGLLAFWAHDLRRRGQSRVAAWVGPLCFGVGLFAGETATVTCAYLLAYALIVDPASRRSRALSLLPYLLILVVWRAFYQQLDYGAFGTDGYVDPAREPGTFLVRFPQALLVLIQGQLGYLPSDFWGASPEIGWGVLACALAFFTLLALLCYPVLRDRAMARFWCLALIGSLIASTPAPPADRTLLFSGVAAAALLAELFAAFFQQPSPLPRQGARFIAAALIIMGLVFRKAVLAPALLPIRSRSMNVIGELSERVNDAIPRVANLSDRTLIIVNPPMIDLASYLALMRETRGEAVPRHVRWFSTAASDVTLTRTSERSLLVRPARGFLREAGDRVFRGSRYPFKLGDKVTLSDMTATITELRADGNPATVVFTFREPLESARYLWMKWDNHRCRLFSLPRVNETVTLPAVDLLKLALGK